MEESPTASDGRDELRDALHELLEANIDLQDVLQESARRMRRYLERLGAGERAAELARAHPVDRARTEDNEAIERFTRARQRSRVATFRRLSQEGMSRKEIADRWGFSQQMVSRIVNHQEAAAGDQATRRGAPRGRT